MMVTENLADVKRAVTQNRVVLVAVVDPDSDEGKVTLNVLERIERSYRGKVMSVVASMKTLGKGDLAISLFVNGSEVMRQKELMGSEAKDYQVLKWSIDHILDGLNL